MPSVPALGPEMSCLRYFFGAGESELLVASANPAVADGNGHLAAGEQTDARDFARADHAAVEQVIGRLVVGPVIAGVIDFDGETSARRRDRGFFDHDLIRKHCPPARADKCRVVGFGRLIEGVLAEETGNRLRELIDEIVFGGDALAVVNGSGIGHGGSGSERVGALSGTSETRMETC